MSKRQQLPSDTVLPVFSATTNSSIQRALIASYQDLFRHHTLQVAAALSYCFVLSVFPGLIFLSAVLGLLPLGNLFNHILAFMGRLLPSDTMHIVFSALRYVLSAHRGTWLSFGMLGIIWTASSSFAAIIEALDIAYDADDDGPYWKTRLLSVALAAISGRLLLTALAVMIVGPRFGDWLAALACPAFSQPFGQLSGGQLRSASQSSRSNSSTSWAPTYSSVSVLPCPELSFRWLCGTFSPICLKSILRTLPISAAPTARWRDLSLRMPRAA